MEIYYSERRRNKAYIIENKMEQKWSPKLTITKGIKTHHGVNIIWTLYHIRWYTYLYLGICSIIITTCYCIEYRNATNLPWDTSPVPKYQPIYYSVNKWRHYQILGGNNDRLIMNLIDKGTYEYKYESFHKIFLDGF